MMFFRRRNRQTKRPAGTGPTPVIESPPPPASVEKESKAGKEDNPLHLHIDCRRGISARSFLDGLRALARSSGDTHSKDAFQIDAMTASIWMEHIPQNDRDVLQDGSRNVNQEQPIKSWEPFRRVVIEAPPEASQIVVGRLQELLDTLEECYEGDIRITSPMFPSVVWHMMAVVLLLDRLRIRNMTCSTVPRDIRSPKALRDILAKFPEPNKDNDDENPVTTTLDGAVLLKVLKPASPFAPNLEFHGKALGKDSWIETELGMGVVIPVQEESASPAPPEAAPPRQARSIQGARGAAATTTTPPPPSKTTNQAKRVRKPRSQSRASPASPPSLEEKPSNAARTAAVQAPRQARQAPRQASQAPGQQPVQAIARQSTEQQSHEASHAATPRETQGPPREVTVQRALAQEEPREESDNATAVPSSAQQQQQQEEVEEEQQQQRQEETFASKSLSSPPPAEEEETSALESPLWNVDGNLTLLATNIDDMTAEHLAFCAELLIMQGAADVWLTPIVMKKGRAAQQLNCLCTDELTQPLLVTIFQQTTTLGVRVWSSTKGLQRVSLRRELVTVEYCRRPIQVKVAYLGKEPVSIKPEYDQCRQLALDTQIPIMNVTEEVKALAKDSQRRTVLSMI